MVGCHFILLVDKPYTWGCIALSDRKYRDQYFIPNTLSFQDTPLAENHESVCFTIPNGKHHADMFQWQRSLSNCLKVSRPRNLNGLAIYIFVLPKKFMIKRFVIIKSDSFNYVVFTCSFFVEVFEVQQKSDFFFFNKWVN